MKFNLDHSIQILSNTPHTIEALIKTIPTEWLDKNEGPDTWSAYDVLGHLIHGEKTDWIPRAKIILSNLEDKTFEPFDRFAQMKEAQHSIHSLLNEFKSLRTENLKILQGFNLSEKDLNKKGIHPDLGEVTLREHLSTWTIHDFTHIVQISRVAAKQYATEIGPWMAYATLLK